MILDNQDKKKFMVRLYEFQRTKINEIDRKLIDCIDSGFFTGIKTSNGMLKRIYDNDKYHKAINKFNELLNQYNIYKNDFFDIPENRQFLNKKIVIYRGMVFSKENNITNKYQYNEIIPTSFTYDLKIAKGFSISTEFKPHSVILVYLVNTDTNMILNFNSKPALNEKEILLNNVSQDFKEVLRYKDISYFSNYEIDAKDLIKHIKQK
jgi:hypothetical protein